MLPSPSLLGGTQASDRIDLLGEAAVMAQFDHANVVQLIGVCSAKGAAYVVLEYAELGSLKDYLQKMTIDEQTRLIFAHQSCLGLQHIHSKHFVHRDVAARNVLVGAGMVAKIADFGLSRQNSAGSEYYRSNGGQLPVRWTAPEALEERRFGQSSDVWSFSVLCYEIWTKAALPYKGFNNEKVWVKVLNGYRLPCPEMCSMAVFQMMLWCWEKDPKQRPTFENLSTFFSEMHVANVNRVAEESGIISDGFHIAKKAFLDGIGKKQSPLNTLSSLIPRNRAIDASGTSSEAGDTSGDASTRRRKHPAPPPYVDPPRHPDCSEIVEQPSNCYAYQTQRRPTYEYSSSVYTAGAPSYSVSTRSSNEPSSTRTSVERDVATRRTTKEAPSQGESEQSDTGATGTAFSGDLAAQRTTMDPRAATATIHEELPLAPLPAPRLASGKARRITKQLPPSLELPRMSSTSQGDVHLVSGHEYDYGDNYTNFRTNPCDEISLVSAVELSDK